LTFGWLTVACKELRGVDREFGIEAKQGVPAIACGLPVVAYGQPELGSPLSEAGILFVPYGDREGLSGALV
jgi:hypothetical protein